MNEHCLIEKSERLLLAGLQDGLIRARGTFIDGRRQMRFINPRTDFAFKKIFGSEESRPILMSFLNAILYDGDPTIVDLTILDPYSVPRLQGMKDTYLDVRVVLRSGEVVLIEMQVLNVEGFEKRVLYNAAKEYANQLQKGLKYSALNPVITLTIVDFMMFREEELENRVINRFALIEKEQFITYPDGDVELVFVELPKFKLALEEVSTLTEKWLYFLRQAPALEMVPDSLSAVPEIDQAFEIANYASLSSDEERALDKKLQWLADQRSLQNTNLQLNKETAKLKEEKVKLNETNDQLSETNDQLSETNDQLSETNDQLSETNERLTGELEKARALLKQAGLSEEEIDAKLES